MNCVTLWILTSSICRIICWKELFLRVVDVVILQLLHLLETRLSGNLIGHNCNLSPKQQPHLLRAGVIIGITIGSTLFVLDLIFALVKSKMLKQEAFPKVDEKRKLNPAIEPNLPIISNSKSKEPLQHKCSHV